jgi:hypothetical protein
MLIMLRGIGLWFHMLSNISVNNTRYPMDRNDDDDDDDDDKNNSNNNKFGGRALNKLCYQALGFLWIHSYLLNETAAVKLI